MPIQCRCKRWGNEKNEKNGKINDTKENRFDIHEDPNVARLDLSIPPSSRASPIPQNITHYDERPTPFNDQANPHISFPANSEINGNPKW